jgi:hypothetical protein
MSSTFEMCNAAMLGHHRMQCCKAMSYVNFLTGCSLTLSSVFGIQLAMRSFILIALHTAVYNSVECSVAIVVAYLSNDLSIYKFSFMHRPGHVTLHSKL